LSGHFWISALLDRPTPSGRADLALRAIGAAAPQAKRAARGLGLAGRLMILTIGFVFLAMGLFYATRLAAYRDTWLRDRVSAARTALMAFDATGPVELPSDLAKKILRSVGAKAIAVTTPDGLRTLGDPTCTGRPVENYDLGRYSLDGSLASTFRTLFAPTDTAIRIVEPAEGDLAPITITLEEKPLIDSLWRISGHFLTISLTIAAVVSCVLWAALWQMVLRPVRRLTSNIIAFGERPNDETRVIRPSARHDEIGRAECALATMQGSLAHELAQRKRLAELGMAVARINHDLRNMLAASQLISDRLATIPDPLAQRLAPRLVATLDRAIQFCQSTLTYGGAREQSPARRGFDLRELVRGVVEAGEAEHAAAVAYVIDIPPKFEVYADPDHVLRMLENLSRNAAQALKSRGAQADRPAAIRFAAIRTEGLALIEISDTGPGFPPEQTERIFEPFQISTSEGGSGLGLAIAADLVTRNGGSIALAPAKADDFYCGARFLIRLPTPERSIRAAARSAAIA
jgi:signal transduction histidine kinase